MPNATSVLLLVRDRISTEFRHAPLGTSAAVLAMADLAWRLFGEHSSQLPLENLPVATDHRNNGLPDVFPVLEFSLFQIAIVFVLHRVNFWISKAAVSLRIAFGALTTILAAYFTSLNAFFLARFYVTSEARHYAIFEPIWLIAVMLSFLLLLVLQLEREELPKTLMGSFVTIATTVLPMTVLLFLTCGFFDPLFMDRLEPIWATVIHSTSH